MLGNGACNIKSAFSCSRASILSFNFKAEIIIINLNKEELGNRV